MAATLSTTSLSAASPATPERQSSFRATALPQRSLLFAGRVGFVKRKVGLAVVRSSPSTPGGISEKVSESIKKAEEACEGDEKSGECAAAWDEVEELSAAASHARDRAKEYDPLENYCQDNPETNECRTFDN
ncbi:calvin cycle protein CP12-1, chloroplastic-like [Phalaenopsis equestris]|uniref:calvin cycle protein CP12-1, chloroplastic-like n=1 Tax=Phalaenopsis equestris TaxID=78828 RepID=UPI0009E4B6E7|nr:calvin cycle protein CP12-1, chloroplastic-like [Phalaenopsis equestris]